MKYLNNEMPEVQQYMKTKDGKEGTRFTAQEMLQTMDMVVNICIGCAGVMSLAQAMAMHGDAESVREIMNQLREESDRHGKLNRAITEAYVDKQLHAQLKDVRKRIDELAGGDEQKRQKIVDIFAKHIDDISPSKILDENETEIFEKIMNKAEDEIRNLND